MQVIPFRALLVTAASMLAWLPASSTTAGELTIRGRVEAPGGEGVANARVELFPIASRYREVRGRLESSSNAEPAASTRTAGSGRFRLEGPADGMWTVVVRAAGFVTMAHDLTPLVEETALPPVRMLRDAGDRVTVRDHQGRPLPGARIVAATATPELWRRHRTGQWRPRERTGRTDESGSLELSRARTEALDLRIFAPGFRESRSEHPAREPVVLEPVAGPLRTLEVRRPDGRPARRALVLAGHGRWLMGEIDKRGRLSFSSPTAGELAVVVLSHAGRAWRHTLPAPDPDQPDERIVLNLEKRRSVGGEVVVAGSGEPLRGAWVWPAGRPQAAVRTDARGHYRFRLPPGEHVRPVAAAAGYLGVTGPANPPSASRLEPLVLSPGAAVRGRVVDPGGSPLASVTVLAANRQGDLSPPTWTGDDGGFFLGRLMPGQHFELRLSGQGLAPAVVEVASLSPFAVRSGLRVVMGRGTTVRGSVVDRATQPVAGVEVFLRPADEALDYFAVWRSTRGGSAHAVTDEQGAFELHHTPPGPFDLTLLGRGVAPLILRQVAVPADGTVFELGIFTLEPAAAIRGVVVDSEDRPVAGARVHVLPSRQDRRFELYRATERQAPDAISGEDGVFSIDTVPAGAGLHLIARLTGYALAELDEVEAPSEELRLVLWPAARVSGRVTTLDGGELTGGWVHLLRPPRRRAGELRPPVPVDAEGRFVFEDVEQGLVQLLADARGYPPAVTEELEIVAGRDAEDVEILLEPGAVLRGRVTDPEGLPLAGARVGFSPPEAMRLHGSAGAASADTGAGGGYRLEGLPLGHREIYAVRADHAATSRAIEILAGENVLDFVLEPAFEVAGAVIDEAGSPVAGATVWLAPTAVGRRYYDQSLGDGRFRFPNVRPGRYRLRASKPGYAAVEAPEIVRVASGQMSAGVIRLEVGVTVAGRILGVEEQDFARLEVVAERHDLEGGRASVDRHGRYQIGHLAAGEWAIDVLMSGIGRVTRAWITIEPGQTEVYLDLSAGDD